MSFHLEQGEKEGIARIVSLKEKEPCDKKVQKEEKIFCVNEERKILGFSPLSEKEAELLLSPID